MFLKVIIILLILNSVLSQEEAEKPTEAKTDAEECKIEKIKSNFVVDLIEKGTNKSICVGSLLNGYWVLTAAECVSEEDAEKNIQVIPARQREGLATLDQIKKLSGSNKPNNVLYKKVYPGSKALAKTSLTANIALLRLEKKIIESKHVSYVTLSKENPQQITGPAYVITWNGEEPSSNLFCQNVEIITMEKCEDSLKEYNLPQNSELICVESALKTPYKGELGAPITRASTEIEFSLVCWYNKNKIIFIGCKIEFKYVKKILESENGGVKNTVCVNWLFAFILFITYFL